MLWTLAAFLVTLSLAIVEFLKKVVNKLKKSYVAYPGDAVIDQALPQEIMEHMMTFLDPRAMFECRLVSKYWRYHATKKNVEIEVANQARARQARNKLSVFLLISLRLREVFHELKQKRAVISDALIEKVLNSERTKGIDFIRAAAIANKHGADLLVGTLDSLLEFATWLKIVELDKKYFILDETTKGLKPWTFNAAGELRAKPIFDEKSFDWYETSRWTRVNVLVDVSSYNINSMIDEPDVELYWYRPAIEKKHFYFIPLDNQILMVLMYLLAPLIVHDTLQSSYLPIIRSWFGQITFVVFIGIQLYIASIFSTFRRPPTKNFYISWSIFLVAYIALTMVTYPQSMNVFAGMGVLGLMFFYAMISKHYFSPYSYGGKMSKKKQYIFITGLALIALMIDWKLVVDAVRDLSIFQTLFNNTIFYGFIALHFLCDNFLGWIERESFAWKYLFKWDEETLILLRNSSLLVILMTLVAPAWQGNH